MSREKPRSRLLPFAVAALVAAALALAAGWWLRDDGSSSAVIGGAGGEGWSADRAAGVRVGALGREVEVVFKPGGRHPRVPADSLVEQIGAAVDVTPDVDLSTARPQILFALPDSVPTDADCAAPPAGRRTVCETGIQVFNTELRGWVPLESHVENGNVLVADAPHFSEYRAVWTRLGDLTVDVAGGVGVFLRAGTSPLDLLGHTAAAYVGQLLGAVSGRFDDAKMSGCKDSPHPRLVATFTRPNERISACVVTEKGTTKLRVGNGWALPVAFTADTGTGLAAAQWADAELTTAVRARLAAAAKGGNTAIASGLDVAAFDLRPDELPGTVTVRGAVSWTAVAADLVLATFQLFFPPARLADRIGPIIDGGNCVVGALNRLKGTAAAEVPGAIAETLKGCLLPKILRKYRVDELAATILKEAKLLPQLVQVGQAAAHWARTGNGIADTEFTLSDPYGLLEGRWIYQCGGSDDAIDFLFQGDDSWVITELAADNSVVSRQETFFDTAFVDGRPVLTVRRTTIPGVKAGDRFTVVFAEPIDGRPMRIEIGDRWSYHRDDKRIPSYC